MPVKKLKFPKKIRKKSAKTYKREADALFSKIIRSRGYCQMKGLDDTKCKSDGRNDFQCCHIVRRRNMRLRFDENNALCGCPAHHKFYTEHEFKWFLLIENYFPMQFEYVKAHQNEKMGSMDWPEIIKRLGERLDEISGDKIIKII